MQSRQSFLRPLMAARARMELAQKSRRGITRSIHALMPPRPKGSAAEFSFGTGERSSSLKLGDKVHSELFHSIECSRGACVCPQPSAGYSFGTSTRITESILEALKNSSLRPVAAEVPVAFGQFGTKMDMIAVDSAGAEVLVSVKTGVLSNSNPKGKKMKPPLMSLDAHDLNAAWVQLLLEMTLVRKAFGESVRPATALIVKGAMLTGSSSATASVIRAPDWVFDTELGDKVFAAIAARKRTVKKKKTTKKKAPAPKRRAAVKPAAKRTRNVPVKTAKKKKASAKK